jgi:hypothetical protein
LFTIRFRMPLPAPLGPYTNKPAKTEQEVVEMQLAQDPGARVVPPRL